MYFNSTGMYGVIRMCLSQEVLLSELVHVTTINRPTVIVYMQYIIIMYLELVWCDSLAPVMTHDYTVDNNIIYDYTYTYSPN